MNQIFESYTKLYLFDDFAYIILFDILHPYSKGR